MRFLTNLDLPPFSDRVAQRRGQVQVSQKFADDLAQEMGAIHAREEL